MKQLTLGVLMLGASVLVLTGCSGVPTAEEASGAPQSKDGSEPASAPTGQLTEGQTATGEFTSPDGTTTGHVEVQLKKNGEGDFGEEYSAEVTITDLETPYSLIGVYGTYWDRTEDSCADTGFSGGDFSVEPGGEIHATLGATWTWGLEGWQTDPKSVGVNAERGDVSRLQEVALIRNQSMQDRDGVESDLSSCINTVIAYAELNWEPSA